MFYWLQTWLCVYTFIHLCIRLVKKTLAGQAKNVTEAQSGQQKELLLYQYILCTLGTNMYI